MPAIGFFNLGTFTIDGVEARALRHGMAGQPGFELFGPWEHGERVRAAILEAGEEFGLVPVVAKGYSTANLESGWVPSPVPAIFTGAETEAYRRWLPAASFASGFHLTRWSPRRSRRSSRPQWRPFPGAASSCSDSMQSS